MRDSRAPGGPKNDDGDSPSSEQRIATRPALEASNVTKRSPKFGMPHATPTRPALEAMRREAATMDRPKPPPLPSRAKRPAHNNEPTRALEGDALAALTRTSAPPPPLGDDAPTSVRPAAALAAMREKYITGDTDGALELASGIIPIASLELDEDLDAFGGLIPVGDEEEVAPSSPLSLTERHSIPRVVMSPPQIAKLPIDHRVGFLLSNMDGMQTLEEILDVCGMPPEEALELVKKLEALAVIEFE